MQEGLPCLQAPVPSRKPSSSPPLISLNPQVIGSKAGDRYVITLSDGKESVILNRVGSLLWEYLARSPESSSEKSLVGFLCESFPGLSQEEATRDVDAFLQKLAAHQFLSLGSDEI